MSLIDINKIIAEKETSEKQNKEETKKKTSLSKKVKKFPINQPPPVKRHIPSDEEFELMERRMNTMKPADNEVKTGVKNMLFKVMSRPAKEKHAILSKKLEDSKFINHYIDNKINLEYLDAVNDNMKFGLIYGYYVLDTIFT
jgi:hypothetical protein